MYGNRRVVRGAPKSPPNDTKFFQGHIFMICTHYKKKVSETQKLLKNETP